jgi:hypothetical protein
LKAIGSKLQNEKRRNRHGNPEKVFDHQFGRHQEGPGRKQRHRNEQSGCQRHKGQFEGDQPASSPEGDQPAAEHEVLEPKDDSEVVQSAAEHEVIEPASTPVNFSSVGFLSLGVTWERKRPGE